MPISAEDRRRYPERWALISERIRWQRASGRCECTGHCGLAHPEGRCAEQDGQPASWASDRIVRVVLTVAHLDHQPENNRSDNLKALCQRCHLRHDAEQHRRTRRRHEREQLEAAGQLSILEQRRRQLSVPGASNVEDLDTPAAPRRDPPRETPRAPGAVLHQSEARAWGQIVMPGTPAPATRPTSEQVQATATYRRALEAAADFRGGAVAWVGLKTLYLAAFQLAEPYGRLKARLAHTIVPEGSLWRCGRGRARWQVVRFDAMARQLTMRSDGGQRGRTKSVRLPALLGKDSNWRRIQ